MMKHIILFFTLFVMATRHYPIVPAPVTGYELNPLRGAWSLVIPQETINYVPNPSGETGTAGWTSAFGTVITRSADAWVGQYSISVSGGIATQGTYAVGTLAAGRYTYSAYVKAKAGSVRVLALIGGSAQNPIDFAAPDTEWTRIGFSVTLATSATLELIYNNTDSANTNGILIDAQQVETGSYATTYFDGDSGKDYLWTGTPHASTSIRLITASDGGRARRFEEFGFRITGYQGAGMPTLDAARQGYGILDGASYEGTRATERSLTLVGDFSEPSFQGVQRQRDALIRAINRDTNLSDAPITLQYQAYDCNEPRGRPLNLRATYIGGLEGSVDNNYQERAAIQFRADQPFFYEAEQDHIALTASQSVLNANAILLADSNNLWAAMGTGLTGGSPYAIARGQTGVLYVGGDFTSAGGVASTANFAYWSGTTWVSAGVVTGGEVRAIAVAANGDVYIGGNFTSAGGVANTARIARYRPSTGAWSALGASGADARVRALAFDNSGTLYLGGDFTTIGGVLGSYLMTWNGTTYAAFASQPNNSVYALALSPGGAMVVGGQFTQVGITVVNYIAVWTTASTWVALSSGMATGVVDAPIVRAVAFMNGILYATGNFVTAGGTTVNHIAMWTGSVWRAMGGGTSTTTGLTLPGGAGQGGYSLAVFNNILHVGGRYTAAGPLSYIFEGYARWNGTAWVLADMNLPGAPTVTAIYADRLNLALGFTTTGTADTSANTAVTVNATANTYPIIRVVNNDIVVRRIYQVMNVTTGDVLFFDLTVLIGETILIDFDAKTVTSTTRGILNSAPLAGSTLARWRLAPKTTTRTTNIINVFMGGTVTITMVWNNRHWSVDGGAY